MGLKYYRLSNNYAGAIDETITPPEGWIEVPIAPERATDLWDTDHWVQTVWTPEVENFCNTLMMTATGQKLITGTPPSGRWSALCGALACGNIVAASTLMPQVAVEYSFSSEDKATVNAMIATYHIPISPLT